MSYAIRAPDYQHLAALSPSPNDEKEEGWGKEKGVRKKRGGKER